jgi:hypothetical protein
MFRRSDALVFAAFWILSVVVASPAAAQALMLWPTLDCVEYDAATDSVTAHFGYINKESTRLSVPFGSNNIFMPAPFFRGQPTSYDPGTYRDVFTVTFPASSYVEWYLGDGFVRATNDPALYCAGCESVAGPPGPQGPEGPQGLRGATGATGPAGATGPQGPQGIAGATGPTGPAGADGATGPQGPPGATGATGATGPEGPMGPTGATGAQGLQGATGPQGVQGETGPVGATGPQGLQGPAGAQGVAGPKGDSGPLGPIGPTGPAGPQGPIGPAGATGPQGSTGPQGPQGAPGPRGAVGEKGARGARGEDGIDGRILSRNAFAANPLPVDGQRTVLSLAFEAKEKATLLLLGTVSCRAQDECRVRVRLDGRLAESSFRIDDAANALLPIPVHARQLIEAGTHVVELIAEGANVTIEERTATVLVFRERM